MPGNHRQRWSSPVLRIGMVSGSLLALGLILLGLPASRGESESLSPQVVAVVPSGGKLHVTIDLAHRKAARGQGKLQVQLLDPAGKVLAKAEAAPQKDRPAHFQVELPGPNESLNQLKLACRWNGENFLVPVKQVLLAKAHETALASGQEFYAGTTTTLRCEVHRVKSITKTLPLAGARITISLRPADGKGKSVQLFAGATGEDGTAEPTFRVPEVPAGHYVLQVVTRSPLGEEKLERPVQVKADAKVLLVTDKPLYQPGQRIHIRALALRPFDLKPVPATDLVFEVEDAKGNKVFKRTQRTSAYGVAAVDFDLADEVNMGAYQVRALLGQVQAQKTVTVKQYVLPKFKVVASADKSFYLPKETIKAEVQSDYFFGKPVAGGKLKVTASTFDFQFRTFQTWEGKTDANGHAHFEIKLPDYFVGQPLQKGNALVRLEVKLTDTADHSETVVKTYPVSAQPIQVSVIPEGGRMVPEMENRVFVAAVYPDGTPARCSVQLWTGREAKGDPVAKVKTNDAGLAEFSLKPKAAQFRMGPWEQKTIETLGGNMPTWGQKVVFDLTAEARDSKGNAAKAVAEVNAEPLGENVMLRLDKAIYQGGDRLMADVRTSAGLPTAYLDIVKNGQTMLTRWLDVKKGKAEARVDLPGGLFGTLEVHAYQLLASGEIIRDSRVVYVQPRNDLKIAVQADKKVYLPGENGTIQFQVTDAEGKPAQAALGVIIVDEAVYALQEMQPGLEKVYFTLQEELLKPQAQAVFKPNENLPNLIRRPVVPAPQQQVAQVLLTSVRPKAPPRWEVAPAVQRQQQMENNITQVGWQIYNYASSSHAFMAKDKTTGTWHFRPELLREMVKANYLNTALLTDPLGEPLDLERLASVEPGFTVDRLAQAMNLVRMQQLGWQFLSYTGARQKDLLKDGKWTFPKTVLDDVANQNNWLKQWRVDPWGTPYRLVTVKKKQAHGSGYGQLDFHQLVSAGPDGKFGTADDIAWAGPNFNVWQESQWWWLTDAGRQGKNAQQRFMAQMQWRRGAMMRNRAMLRLEEKAARFAGPLPAAAEPRAAAANGAFLKKEMDAKGQGVGMGGHGGGGSAAPPVRVREYFPETLKWEPALITDEHGRATLVVPFADSITTWRLSASASSRAGALGGVSAPLRVFQDFFVDLDLPVALTQNDEVSFPVAVYNYLKQPQTIRLELKQEPWFELTDGGGLVRSLDLEPNEVTSVKFRIRAARIGFQPLQVKAFGTKMSDAVKRTIEVVPDGKRLEQVVTDRLSGKVTQTIVIPPHALPDASKLTVKIYPGVMSQVLEGAEGLLRLPGG